MRDSAIYFPFIDVPPTPWLTGVLFYWDTLWSIVPMEYVHSPEMHTPFMRELLAAGLVSPCVPMGHIPDVDTFGSQFIGYIERAAGRRRALGIRPLPAEPRARIHIEKLGGWSEELVRLGLARRAKYPWYEAEPWVARAYMAFLASVIGMAPDVSAVPVTNSSECFRLLSGKRSQSALKGSRPARDVILPALFPLPAATAKLSELVDFKASHGAELRALRMKVEGECEALADIDDVELRDYAAKQAAERLRTEAATIADAIQTKWTSITFGGLFAVLGAPSHLAGDFDSAALRVSAGSALTTAIYGCYSAARDLRNQHRKPLAYAALAARRFKKSAS